MTKLKLYFAHSFDDRFKFHKIEKKIESIYNIELHNPFYDVERHDVKELDKLGKTRKQVYEEMMVWDMNKCKDLVERDLQAIQQCDGILTIIKSTSIGTSMEIIACAYFYRKPVFIITKTHKGHPWLRYMASQNDGMMFCNLRQFRKWLKENGYERRKRFIRV